LLSITFLAKANDCTHLDFEHHHSSPYSKQIS